MSILAQVVEAAEQHQHFIESQVAKARSDTAFADEILGRWKSARDKIEMTTTPTGLKLPRLALPDYDEPGQIARYLFGQGLPGEFPFANAAYREMYLEPAAIKDVDATRARTEEPTRLFAGLGLPQDTNARFHYLTRHQRSARLSTAFDGPTLYGLDSDAEGVLGKIGEGGVAVDTIDDMETLYHGFDLSSDSVSVSMTINGPAPAILAMFVAAAKRRFGESVVPNLRGTIQADILKEVQAQNETLFPLDASLRFLTDMVQWTTTHMPRWYPISISGYHIAEAGATPVQQAAYTLSNGFVYAELFRARGMDVNVFGPRLSFFLDCALDVEYLALARVCRKLWAIGMRDIFNAEPRAQILKLHTQTSGRSLVAHTFKNNLTRTAVELMISYINATNSCHSNSADEPFTTPGEEYVKLAANAQSIILEESGFFKHMMNSLGGSPGILAVEKAVESAILEEFRQLDELGGVLAAIEHRYHRSQIQSAAHRYEKQIYDGTRPIIGLNRYNEDGTLPDVKLSRTSESKRRAQVDRVKDFKHKHRSDAAKALNSLAKVVESDGNVFAELIQTVEHCTLGQITECLQEVVGHYRPTI